jgi:hypothetical protein
MGLLPVMGFFTEAVVVVVVFRSLLFGLSAIVDLRGPLSCPQSG